MSRQNPLKILFLTSSYPRDQEDVASVFLRYFAEALAARGNEVQVLAPADGKSATDIDGKIAVHRFQYFPLRWQKLAYGSGIMPNLKRSPWLWLQVPFFCFFMAISLFRLLAAHKFDLLHAHWLLPQGLLGILGKWIFRLPSIVTAHGTDAFALKSNFSTQLKRLVLTHSDAWTTNTAVTATATEELSSTEPRVIPMGVDVARFCSGRRNVLRRELPDGESLVLFVGRLIESKGCHDLLKAIAALPQTFRERTTLWLVGGGEQREILERAARSFGILNQTKFFGWVSQEHLPNIYAAADVVVIPSKLGSAGETEGQGIVVLEAFAARACVLATHLGGIPSMVRDNDTGLLVEPDNPQALADAIQRLLDQPELRRRLADNAFAEVRNRYSWTKIAGEFVQLYREVLASRQR